MPSKEEVYNDADPKYKQDLFSKELDELVLEIKENLRLKAKPASYSKSRLRASPYSVPSRTDSLKCDCCDSKRCLRGRNCSNGSRRGSDDPYEVLQELLKDGDLIKEAVRRIHVGFGPKRCVYYDSDDELRTPPFPFDDVEV